MTTRRGQPVGSGHRAGAGRVIAAGVVAAWLSAAGVATAQPGNAGSGILGDRSPGLPNVTPEPLKNIELKNHLGSTIPLQLSFTTSDGQTVQLKELFNKPLGGREAAVNPARRPVVLMLMYFRCPMLCPMVLDRMTQQFRGLDKFDVGTEFDVVVVSFDARDTLKDAADMKAAAIAGYGRVSAADAATTAEGKAKLETIERGWTFLIGTPEQSKALADAVGFSYRYLPETGQFAHGAAFFVLTPEGRISRYVTDLTGSSTNLRLSLVEASGGGIGSWTDQLMLRCLHFNPADGTYSLAVMQVTRVLAVLGVGALGGMIGMHLVRERRRRHAAGEPAPSTTVHTPLATGPVR